jgi:chemotaxis protein histidine kinase CheA
MALPDRNERRQCLEEVAKEWLAANPGRPVKADAQAMELLIENMSGLTLPDTQRMARKAIFDDGVLQASDLPGAMRTKYELLNRRGILSYEHDTARFADVGGLKNLKAWLEKRRAGFNGSAPQLDPPKGVLLLGVQGCGKSVASRATAGVFGIPLLRLDCSALFDKFVGEFVLLGRQRAHVGRASHQANAQRPGFCSRCHQWLGFPRPSTQETLPTDYQAWVAQQFGQLLEIAPHAQPVGKENIQKILVRYVASFAEGSRVTIAESAGCCRSSFYNWYNGASTARVDLLLRMCHKLRIPLTSLVTGAIAEPEGADTDLISSLERMVERVGSARTRVEAPHTVGTLVSQVQERPLRSDEDSLDDLERAFRETLPDEPVIRSEHAPAVEAAAKDDEAAKGANQSIRVTVDTLEQLMTMVSELVLTRNQLLEIVRRHEESEFKTPLQRLSSVTAELQEGVMKTRMQPIGNAWQKLPRIVRDLANELGKKIELETHGAETELDRQVLDLIKDPLTHMVRNSADHGLETPEQRRAAGKPEQGQIRLSAYHEGGYIIIQVADDGRGLDSAPHQGQSGRARPGLRGRS